MCSFILALQFAPADAIAQRSKFGLHRIEAQFAGPDGPYLMDKTAETGVGWIIIRAHWVFIERNPPSGPASNLPGRKSGNHAYDWSEIDAAVIEARTRALNVVLQLTKGPDWVTGAPAGCGGDLSESNDDCGLIANSRKDLFKLAWEDLCYNAAARYSPQVLYFILWNEPNLRPNFNPEKPYDNVINEYLNLIVVPGHNGIKAASLAAKVAGPEITTLDSYWGNWRFNGVDPLLRFFGDWFDVFTVHSYNIDAFTTVSKMTEVRLELAEHGWLGKKPVWLTEFNFRSGTCDQTDAQMEAQIEILYRSMDTSWWKRSFYFNLVDGGPCGFGLLLSKAVSLRRQREQGSPIPYLEKPLYSMFKNFAMANGSDRLRP
ncbi:MAG TPA: glycosyl hydrolase [Acidobacteriota bacterium]